VPADGTRAPTDPGRCQEGEVPPRLLVGPPGKRKLVDLPVGGVFNGELTLRHRFEDFSGAYVLHCHILGHEDRGMMQNLQTVCPNGMYGRPASYWIDGGGSFLDEAAVPPVRQRECRPDGYKPALPACAAAPHGGPEAPHG
jgi:hypothetical protein